MLTGVILAGGQNRRMGGQAKALLTFSNERLIERQIRMMQRNCDEIIVVTNDPKSLLQILGNTVRIITDYIQGKGPLCGMHAAFTLSKNPDLWVVACDMPFISVDAADLMWKRKQELQCDAVVPCVSGMLHPLHGIYHESCSSRISSLLDRNQYKVQELFNSIQYEAVTESSFVEQDIDLRFVFNVNTPEEYKHALQLEDPSHD
jgi:molybdopterin-guanine dinucleotide biosynthesis protein A